MRVTTIGVVLSSLVMFGCEQAGAPRTGGNDPSEPAVQGNAAAGPNGANAPAAAPGTQNGAPENSPAGAGALRAEWRDVTIPAGTTLAVVLEDSIGSDISRVEQPVHAHLTHAIAVDGVTAVPEGSTVSGAVTEVAGAAKVKGRAHIALRFDSLAPTGDEERYKIRTTAVDRTAPATKKKDAVKVLAPAAGGAIIGRIVGGRKGALIGTAAGAGAGTAVVMSTRGEEVRLAKGAALTLRLSEPLTVRVRG